MSGSCREDGYISRPKSETAAAFASKLNMGLAACHTSPKAPPARIYSKGESAMNALTYRCPHCQTPVEVKPEESDDIVICLVLVVIGAGTIWTSGWRSARQLERASTDAPDVPHEVAKRRSTELLVGLRIIGTILIAAGLVVGVRSIAS